MFQIVDYGLLAPDCVSFKCKGSFAHGTSHCFNAYLSIVIIYTICYIFIY